MKVKVVEKVDFGCIMLDVSQEDLNSLKEVLVEGKFECPNMKIAVYKNRRGKYVNVLLWARADKGTCRIKPMFVTNYQYELQEIQDMKIYVKPKIDVSAF